MGKIKLPIDIDPAGLLRDLEKQRCERSLAYFVKAAWPHIEPAQPYVHNWHVDMICEHLEAITNGVEIDGKAYNRLLINIPPGTMKSLLLNVFWPSFEWGPRNMPHLRYVCAAHKVENLSARDSRRMRQLVTSDWYQSLWGDRVSLAKDQNEKLNFVNSANGFRIATAITSLTGIRGDRVIIDDPHSVDSAASEVMLQAEVTTFLEAIPTRLTNPLTSAIVVIMQRLHESDVSGAILDGKLGYDHVMLPMRYDTRRAGPTMLGTVDPREEDGELLFPERFPEEVVARDERVMGPYATAGQYQQEPVPRGGGVIKDDWWQLWIEAEYPPMDFILASLDTAYTTKQENDYSAMTIWGVFSTDTKAKITKTLTKYGSIQQIERVYEEGAPNVMLMHAFQERLEFPDLLKKVADKCRELKVDKLIIENKAAGISLAQELRRSFSLDGFGIQLVDPKGGDKLARLYSVQHLFSEGMIWAPDKDWAEMVIRQTSSFPKGKHDDLVDSLSQALRHLRETGLLTRSVERIAEIEQSRIYKGRPPPPLYPA